MTKEINRRPLLKVLGTGVGAGTAFSLLPSSWTQPIVQSVIVPVHAQASPHVGVTTTTAAPGTTGS